MPPPASPRLRYLPRPCDFADNPLKVEASELVSNAISNITRSRIREMREDSRNVLLADLVSEMGSEDLCKFLHQRRILKERGRIHDYLASTTVTSLGSLDRKLIDVVSVCSTENSQARPETAGSVYLRHASHEHFGRTYTIGPQKQSLEITGYKHHTDMDYLTGSMIEQWYVIGAKYGGADAIAKTVLYEDPGVEYRREHHIGMKTLLGNVATDLGLMGGDHDDLIKGLMELFWTVEVVNHWGKDIEEAHPLVEIVLSDIEMQKDY
jgi:hypothetical protein